MGELVPKEEAIQQAVQATGLPEATIREYAEQMKALGRVDPMVSVGAIVAVSNAYGSVARAAFQATEAAKAAGITAERSHLYYNGQDITPFVESVRFGPQQVRMPDNPANRRTFRLAGKLHHFIQTEDGLATRPGESPWI
jgi:hypothetical protein